MNYIMMKSIENLYKMIKMFLEINIVAALLIENQKRYLL